MLSSFLDEQGIARPGLRVLDGCGLSRRNRATASTLSDLLVKAAQSEHGELFVSTLATPGRPGTLIKRSFDVGARIAAKTGYIREVFSLSGYLFGQSDTFAFSFIVNGRGSGARAYALFNSLLVTVYNWDAGEAAVAGCESDDG